LRQICELLAQLGIEVTACLVIGKAMMSIGRRLERIPSYKDSSREFLLIEAQQDVCESDDRSSTFATPAPDRFRKCMIGSVRKGVAIDHQKRASTHANVELPLVAPAELEA